MSELVKVIEECSELIQILCKVDRFGWFNHHPDNPKLLNIEQVYYEILDVTTACNELIDYMKQIREENERNKS